MIIRFRKKSQAEWLIFYILIMPFLFFMMIELLHFPTSVKYTLDVAWLMLLLIMTAGKRKQINPETKTLISVVSIFFGITVVSYLLNIYSPLYYLWGMRNNGRHFVFFFACIFFLTENSSKDFLKLFDYLFWINFPIVLFQFFVMGKQQDHLGGFFGVEKGCNSFMNIFLVIVMAKSILSYVHHEETLRMVAGKSIVSLLITVLSELKFFWVELIVIALMVAIMTGYAGRKATIAIGSAVGIAIAIQLFVLIFPQWMGWFSLENLIAILVSDDGYASGYDMNRLTAIPMSLEYFLKTWLAKLFGMGLGNCDTSAFSFLDTPFNEAYAHLHYTWFSTSFVLLETGLLGLFAYTMFFVAAYFQAGKREKEGSANVRHCQLAKIMAVMSVLIIVYNCSLRTEAGYMVYFVLALPFVNTKKNWIEKRIPNKGTVGN